MASDRGYLEFILEQLAELAELDEAGSIAAFEPTWFWHHQDAWVLRKG